MTDVFTRGSAVLDYWLTHPEGLTVQPLNAPVERAVGPTPFGPAVALVVRTRNGRERRIPADDVAAVDPGNEELLLDGAYDDGDPFQERAAAIARSCAAWTAPRVEAGARWLAPRARAAAIAAAKHTWFGARWLAPRLLAASRSAAALSRWLWLRYATRSSSPESGSSSSARLRS